MKPRSPIARAPLGPVFLLLLLALAGTCLSPTARQERLSVIRPEPGLTVSTRTVRYEIRGRKSADLRAQMNRLGPLDRSSGRRFDAYTSWNFYWRFSYSRGPRGCGMREARVSVELEYTYPRWLRPVRVSATLVRRWNRYLRALRRHENGHGAIAIGAGRRIVRAIRALPPRSSCRRLGEAANRLGRKEIDRVNAAQAAYDARTNHGATQGAHFP